MVLGVFYFFIEIIDNLFQAISLNSQFSDCCKTTEIDSTMVAIVTEKSLTQIHHHDNTNGGKHGNTKP